MSIRIQTSVRGFARAGRVLGNLSHLDMTDLLDHVGQMIENQVKGRISNQEGPPEGGSWAEYKKDETGRSRYEKWKKTKSSGGFLELHGHLRDGIQHVVTGGQVAIGSGEDYAATQQLGSKDGATPARPYLGLTDENEDDIEDLVKKWLAKQAAA